MGHMVEAKVEGGRSTGTKHHNPYKSSLNVSEVSEINYQVSKVKVNRKMKVHGRLTFPDMMMKNNILKNIEYHTPKTVSWF